MIGTLKKEISTTPSRVWEALLKAKASLREVEKALQPKHRTDPTTKLPQEFHEFLELFSEKEIIKLPPNRPNDHQINFIKKNQDMAFYIWCLRENSKFRKNSSMKI